MKTLHLAIIIVSAITISFGVYYLITFEIDSNTFHVYITGIHHLDQGYAFQEGNSENPPIYVPIGSNIILYLENNDYSIDSMDFNIDAFNVHSNPLAYQQKQTIEFLADKEGIFTYYSKLHPDMNGTIIVRSQQVLTFIQHP